MKIPPTDARYIQDRLYEIKCGLNNNDLVSMNTETIRLAMHIQDLIKKKED